MRQLCLTSFVCPISIVPIPSSNEEIRLVDDAFGKISHMVSDGSWMVRVQAAKTLVSDLTEALYDEGPCVSSSSHCTKMEPAN